MQPIDWKKYFIVLVLTLSIFGTAFYVSTRLNSAKLQELQTIQDRISTDLLSSEMQFSLLSQASCDEVKDVGLSEELSILGGKLSYAEGEISTNEEDILWLKKNYFLLEMKDYLLSKRIAERCAEKPFAILYFYGNVDSCEDCRKQGAVLTSLRQTYPSVRVYSFDYSFDLSALKTLIRLHKIEKDLPALVIDGKTYYGLKTEEDIEGIAPAIKKLLPPDETATTTQKKATTTNR